MAYKIEAHMVDRNTEEITTTATFWGANRDEAQKAYEDCLKGWSVFSSAGDDDRLVIDESTIDDDERPAIEDEEEEEEEEDDDNVIEIEANRKEKR